MQLFHTVESRKADANDATTKSSGTRETELDLALRRIEDRALAAGMEAWRTQVRYPNASEREQPFGLRIDFPAGRVKRGVHLHREHALKLDRYPFERWVFLGEYEAILDLVTKEITAGVDLCVAHAKLNAIPGAELIGDDDSELAELTDLEELSPYLQPARLRVDHRSRESSIELQCPAPGPIRAGCEFPPQYGLRIRGITETRHDDALRQLVDLSTSFFLDLDISYGLTARLQKSLSVELPDVDDYAPEEEPSAAAPRFPIVRYNHDAASLYLYARTLIQTPLLEYLAYYQVIELHMPMYARSASIQQLRDIIKNPRFDHNDDVALGRVVDMLTRGGRNSPDEKEQVEATLSACLGDVKIETYLTAHPDGAKALADKQRIGGVRWIDPRDRHTPLVAQVSNRIYGLRCRIVHGKDGGDGRGEPIRPFGRESKLLQHDLSLIRFVAQHVLITSSRPAPWS